jgi:hypothetical protein
MCSCSNLGAANRLIIMCDNCKASGHTDYFRHFCSFLVEKEGHGDTGHACPSMGIAGSGRAEAGVAAMARTVENG